MKHEDYMKNRIYGFCPDDFKCMMCGECCRAGYDVFVSKEDVKKWINLGKNELLDYIIINPQCISINNEAEINSEDGITVKRIKKQYIKYDRKIQELREFIQKNHQYSGRNSVRLYIKTILEDLDYDPLLAPKNFNTILKGLKYGLEYIIKTDTLGKCAFLNLNQCSIHNFKPIACIRFPYTKDKCLRKDFLFLSICSGLKEVKES